MMKEIQLQNIDLNLLVVFEVLMDELSVVRAADRLGRTPSAISHSLARLRQTFGDPLLVKAGGQMKPSPVALTLVEQVRPILRGIQRLVHAPERFDETTSRRLFRIAGPVVDPFFIEMTERVSRAAPNVSLEWVPQNQGTYAQVADEQIDLAYGNADTPLPDGLREKVLPPVKRYVFARRDHPGLDDWGVHSWLSWPHIVVGLPSTASADVVGKRIASLGLERKIGLRAPNWSVIGPILLRTNMLANQNPVIFHQYPDLGVFRALKPPVDLPDLTFRVAWSARLDADPALTWLRSILISCMEDLIEAATTRVRMLA